MVVILPEAHNGEWLDAPPERSMEFMRQFPAERLAMVAEPAPPKASKASATPAQPLPPAQPPLL